MKKILNSNHLKLIAIIAMTIDHFTDLIFPNFPAEPLPMVLHTIGRLTAPIMWFFICEGFFYTKNLKKYIGRMLILALISHFAYNFAFGINYIPFTRGSIFNQTSVIWPLAMSLVVLWITNRCDSLKQWQKTLILIAIYVATFPSDWSCIAILAIVKMYKNRGNLKKQMISMMLCVLMYAVVCFFFVNKVYAIISIGVILVYPVLSLYNGERGKARWMKWLFYIYYPLHLIIIGIIRLLMMGNAALIF